MLLKQMNVPICVNVHEYYDLLAVPSTVPSLDIISLISSWVNCFTSTISGELRRGAERLLDLPADPPGPLPILPDVLGLVPIGGEGTFTDSLLLLLLGLVIMFPRVSLVGEIISTPVGLFSSLIASSTDKTR